MSERLLLEAFREDAERVMRPPAFEVIEAARRARQRRRRAVGAAVAACLLVGATGVVALQDRGSPGPQPAGSGTRSSATPWPGPTMTTLQEGDYDLSPFADVALPAARVTVPDGWNAAQWGPDRFAGMGPAGAGNEQASRESAWYAALVVLEVVVLSKSDCDADFLIGADTAEVLDALTALPRQEVTSGPVAVTRFGRPAVHLTLREIRREPDCAVGQMFSNAEGRIGQLGLGGRYDVSLVDVEGEPLLVVAGWTRNAPPAAVEELMEMADSIELHPRERPWLEVTR